MYLGPMLGCEKIVKNAPPQALSQDTLPTFRVLDFSKPFHQRKTCMEFQLFASKESKLRVGRVGRSWTLPLRRLSSVPPPAPPCLRA